MFRLLAHETFPLHTALLEHHPDDVIEEIRDNFSQNFNFTQQDRNGRNLLQLAASRGFVQVVLWLAYANVPINPSQESEKTPLYLAVEHGHWLITQILLILGADKNKALDLARKTNNPEVLNTLNQLKIDLDVFRAVLYWVVANYHPIYGNNLLNLIKPQIAITEIHKLHIGDDEKSVSEKAHFLTIDEEKIRDQISLSEVQDDLYGFIELATQKNLTNLVLALFEINQQKIRTNPSCATMGYWAARNDNTEIHKKLVLNNDEHAVLTLQQLDDMKNENHFDKFITISSEKQKKKFLELSEDHHEEKMPKKQAKIFYQAKFFEVRKLKHFKHNELNQNYFTVLDFVFKSRNFVALNALIQVADQNKLFEYALINKQRELFFILIFLNNQYTHELMQQCPDKMNNVFALMGRNNEKNGSFCRIINHGVSDILQDPRKSSEIRAQKNYFQEMKLTENQFTKMYCKYVHERDVKSAEDAFNSMPGNALVIIRHAKRFGFDLSHFQQEEKAGTRLDQLRKDFFRLENGPIRNMLPFLDAKSRGRLSTTSSTVYGVFASASIQLLMINHFLQELQNEINHMPYFSHRNYAIPHAVERHLPRYMWCMILCYIAMPLSIWYVVKGKGEDEKNHIGDGGMGDAAIAGIVIGGFMHLITIGYLLYNFIKALLPGNERFDPKPLTILSNERQHEAKRLFAICRNYPNFDLTHASTIGEIVPRLNEMKETLQTSLSPHQLFAAPRLADPEDAKQPLLRNNAYQI